MVGRIKGRTQLSKKLIYACLHCHFMFLSLDSVWTCMEVSDSAAGKVGRALSFSAIGVGAYKAALAKWEMVILSRDLGFCLLWSRHKYCFIFLLMSVHTILQFLPKKKRIIRNSYWEAAVSSTAALQYNPPVKRTWRYRDWSPLYKLVLIDESSFLCMLFFIFPWNERGGSCD